MENLLLLSFTSGHDEVELQNLSLEIFTLVLVWVN